MDNGFATREEVNNKSFLKYPDRDYGFVERGGMGGLILNS